jgi:hypothetical protein
MLTKRQISKHEKYYLIVILLLINKIVIEIQKKKENLS